MRSKRGKRWVALLLLVVLAFGLTGCWDRVEIDELGYILAIGVDKAPSGGHYYTFWLAVPRKLAPTGPSGGGGGAGGGGAQMDTAGGRVHVAVVEASTLLMAMQLMNTYVARRITLEHAKALVVGEDLARSDMLNALAPAVRFREFRRNMLLVVTRGRATDWLQKNNPSIEENPARWIELMASHQELNGLITKSRIHEFMLGEQSLAAAPLVVLTGINSKAQGRPPGDGQDSSGGGQGTQSTTPTAPNASYLAGDIPRWGLNPTEMIGAAVFSGAKMVAEMNGDEVRAALMLRGELQRIYYSQADPVVPGYYVGLDIRQARPPLIQVGFADDRPVIDATVELEGDITGIHSLHDYVRPDETLRLEEAVAAGINKQLKAIVGRAQREFHGDIFNFGDHARARFLTWKEWADYRWNEHFSNAEITTHVKFHVRRIGLQVAPPAPPAGEPLPPSLTGSGGGQP